MEKFVQVSDRLNRIITWVGKLGSIAIIPLIIVTIWDVVTRKFTTFQLWVIELLGDNLQSTVLQEWEWHFHTALFASALGYGYVANSHVRVDVIRERLPVRKQAWVEWIGVTIAMIPYCCVLIWFSWDFAYKSFIQNEISYSLVGLSNRWIIKGILFLGFVFALLAGISVWLRKTAYLFGPPGLNVPLLTVQEPMTERVVIASGGAQAEDR